MLKKGRSFKERNPTRHKGREQKLKNEQVLQGLEVTHKMGKLYHTVANVTEKVAMNPGAYTALRDMKGKVDDKVYRRVLMDPDFISDFIDVYKEQKGSARLLLQDAKARYRTVGDSEMNSVAGYLGGKLGQLRDKALTKKKK